MFLNLIVNIVTPFLVLNNCYGYYKDKKNRHYKYYFLIISLFLAFDSLLSYITQFVPFFEFLKLSFIIWLSLPLFNGPSFLYNFYMKKIFNNYENEIDQHMEKARVLFVNTVMNKLNQAYGKYKKMNGKLLETNKEEGKVQDIENDLEKIGNLKENFKKMPNINSNNFMNKENIADVEPFGSGSKEELDTEKSVED